MNHAELFRRWLKIDRDGMAFPKLFGTMEANQDSRFPPFLQKAEAADIFFEEVARIVEEEEKRKGGVQS